VGDNTQLPDAIRFRYSLLLREIDSLRSAADRPTMALMLIQLAGMDGINQRYGYLAGDRVLDEFAGRLTRVGRAQDRLFEVNARTFALLIHNPLHAGHAVLAAEKVSRVAQEPVILGTVRARVKVHIGIAVMAEAEATGESLVHQCELALAAARARDEHHVLFTPEMEPERNRSTRHTWFDVEEALKAGDFEVFFQPQVALATGRLVGAEALVRWRDARNGYIGPDQFLPVIEHSQGVRALLWYVLNSALRQVAEWSRQRPGFKVSVNLAAGNLDDQDLVDQVENALKVWQVPPGQLTLELTESSLLRNPEECTRLLGALRGLGTRVSIDDFGTGYSSLSYLRDLPADELKVDRSFVVNAAASQRDRNIVASIVQLAHAVDLEVVAEGIEDAGMEAMTREVGCDIGQGYHYGRPLPGREFAERWLSGAAVAAPAGEA
jgi:diguanylate cyclase (GGDEF)-like protein